MVSGIEIPIIIGLVAVGVAIFERAVKTFLEKKKEIPDLKFDGAYLVNALISTGVGAAVITMVIPALISELGDSTVPLTLASVLLNFIVGYSVTYRTLDGLNNSTAAKVEIAELKETVE